MTIDKNWTRPDIYRDSAEFWAGLNAFLERCKNHLDHENKAHCPCRTCNNFYSGTITSIRAHIQRRGFSTSYKTWTYHGESYPLSVVVHDTSQTTDEMVDVLNDVQWENSGNENNTNADEPTEGSGATNAHVDELLAFANDKLYPGSSMSALNFLAKISHIKAINKWSNSSFTELLLFLGSAFPKPNKIPSSHYEVNKIMNTIGLGYESIHACKNDCCLFYSENKDLQTCPICSASRWKDKDTKGKKVPNKVLRYFPLTPRLKRLYSSRHTADFMTWHATGRCTEDGKMWHPVDGKAWKDFDTRYPDFASETRNVRLGLAADGFNPYGNMSLSYNMWPVILTTYNTPPWLCMKESSLMLTLLIPGPKSPGKDMDVFLRPLVDELKTLWTHGAQTRDAVTETVFTMRAMLLWTINDFPARSSLSGWSGQGYKACPTCNVDTPSTRVLGKTAFVGHRRFLPANHHWRKNKKFNGMDEKRGPPATFDKDAIEEQHRRLRPKIPGKHPAFGGMKRKRPEEELNWTKRSIFFELEYWSSLELKHNLDVMHIEKNVCESLLGTLLMNDKSKDTENARKDLKALGIRKELWLQPKANGKDDKPHAQYSFTADRRRHFCEFIKRVKLPDGFGSNFKRKVSENDNNITGMKSHDCHIMMQRLIPVGVRGSLHHTISTPIIELCAFFKQICARTLMTSDMFNAKEQLVKILCAFEQIYPPAFFDVMIHLVMHLPDEAIQGGPVYMRWMYPFERYMKKLKNYVRNKARPEGSIAEGYVAEEALTFCSMYLQGVSTRFNRPDRNEDAPITPRLLRVFQSVCTPISKRVHKLLDHTLQKKVEWYVLNNCHEIDTHKTQFNALNPEGNEELEFPLWFNKKICNMRALDDVTCTEELFALANGCKHANSYTMCIVNGVRWVVHSRDTRRTTQNSGVSTPGLEGVTFYGQLEEILELNYLSGCKVVLFQCKWFNTSNTSRVSRCVTKNNITSISIQQEWYKDDQYILATQATQIFYLEDPTNKDWRVVQEVNHRKIWDQETNVEDNEQDVIHGSNSSDLALSASLDDLTYTNLNVAGQSTEVISNRTFVRNEADFICDEDEDVLASDHDSDSGDDVLSIHDESDLDGDNERETHYCSSDES